jgi:hypothetical protein
LVIVTSHLLCNMSDATLTATPAAAAAATATDAAAAVTKAAPPTVTEGEL